ncbi:hypothetical protein CRG98_031684 [Punica granatum]|uniref:Uncharacterized protein n=1 Tax=Punica granatum TaxID=22663 RepID=A0A2I0IW59_PUNGR|nr:hypothetical protein CRG98_031684 [Punica granatum]
MKKLLKLEPLETWRSTGLGQRTVGEKGGASEKKGKKREKEGKKRESCRAQGQWAGLRPDLAWPSLEGSNQAWASPESGSNLEWQNRPDFTIHGPIHLRFHSFRLSPLAIIAMTRYTMMARETRGASARSGGSMGIPRVATTNKPPWAQEASLSTVGGTDKPLACSGSSMSSYLDFNKQVFLSILEWH